MCALQRYPGGAPLAGPVSTAGWASGGQPLTPGYRVDELVSASGAAVHNDKE
jgi:hypothetical protein